MPTADQELDRAFLNAPRKLFLPESEQAYARYDQPLAIGHGQTNSQPTVVRLMLEWLDVKSGNNVLDVGSGSGWTTALLSFLVGSKGSVMATERIPELLEFGRNNCEALGIRNVSFQFDPTKFGWPAAAPYDRILVSAEADELPQDLVNQLADGGIMVVPILNSIWVIKKQGTEILKNEHKGYIFVPLL